MYLFQGNNCNPGEKAVKRANSRKRERSDSTKSVLAYATPPDVSSTEPDATGDTGKQVDGSLAENSATGDMR